MLEKPDRVYIEECIREHPLTKKILSVLESVPVTFIQDHRNIGKEKTFTERASKDKNCLALAYKKGELVKSIGRMEDGQFYLFHETDCRYDCEYCYLQYYFQTKIPVIFVNRDEVLSRIEAILRSRECAYFHAGEVSDALAFDDLTQFSLDIAKLFSRYENGKIELRTKSTKIENLISIDNPPRNIIPSWTFSPQKIVETIEHKTPSFEQRLNAAKKCQESGYTIGVRLDPVVRVDVWEREYKQMVVRLLTVLDTANIDYISLGTLKHNKMLFDAIKNRFPGSPAILGEMLPSSDGKYRYLKFLRVELYKKMISWIRDIDSNLKVELSLESDEIHELVYDAE